MPVARMRPIRTLRPWGAILLAKPAEPPVGSRGAREAALAVEAGSLRGSRPWRLVISRASVSSRGKALTHLDGTGKAQGGGAGVQVSAEVY